MKFIVKILLLGLLVLLLANFMPGVAVSGYGSAILVALVLSVLNAVVRPILVLLSLPITILTLGLFLLVINALIILLADALLSSFDVNGFWIAFLLSILISLGTWIIEKIVGENK
jgi:putative membrane protein